MKRSQHYEVNQIQGDLWRQSREKNNHEQNCTHHRPNLSSAGVLLWAARNERKGSVELWKGWRAKAAWRTHNDDTTYQPPGHDAQVRRDGFPPIERHTGVGSVRNQRVEAFSRLACTTLSSNLQERTCFDNRLVRWSSEWEERTRIAWLLNLRHCFCCPWLGLPVVCVTDVVQWIM